MSKSHPQGAGNYQGNEDLMDKNIRDIIGPSNVRVTSGANLGRPLF